MVESTVISLQRIQIIISSGCGCFWVDGGGIYITYTLNRGDIWAFGLNKTVQLYSTFAYYGFLFNVF